MSHCMVGLGLVLCAATFVLGALAGDVKAGSNVEAGQVSEPGTAEQAADVLQARINAGERSSEVYRLLGHAHLAAGREAAARDAFVEALSEAGMNADVLGALAYLDQRAGRKAEAVAWLQWLASMRPGEQQYVLALADSLLACGAVDWARVVVRDFLERVPQSSEAWRMRARVAAAGGLPSQAARALMIAYALGPADAELARDIAELQYQAGAPAAGVLWYERAIHLAPDRSRWRVRLGAMLVGIGEHERARVVLREAMDDEAERAEALHWLGFAEAGLGRQIAAVAHWREAVEAGLRSGDVLMTLVRWGVREGDASLVEACAPLLAESGWRSAEGARLLVRASLLLDDAVAAEAVVCGYVERFGMDEDARVMLAEILDHAAQSTE